MIAEGDTLRGRFRLDHELEAGSQGRVFRAVDLKGAGRVVAVKLATDPRAVAGEEKLARLDHPTIPTVLEVGTVGAETYIAREWARGESLADWAQGPRRERADFFGAVLSIITQVAEGLGAAHSQSVCHFDLSPDNVFVLESNDGIRVKIIDFGLSETHVAGIGTPPYMAPELFQEGAEPGRAADFYAVGCVLYELIGGHPPFGSHAPPDALEHAHCNTAPVRLPGLSDTQWAVLAKLLAKDPNDRYATATQLLADLKKLRVGIGWPEGNPFSLLVVGCVAGTVLFGLAMASGGATSYAAEWNWSLNYVLIAPVSWFLAFRSLRRANDLVARMREHEAPWIDWLSFRRVFRRVVPVVFALTITTSIYGHLQRTGAELPEWAKSKLLLLPAAVCEGAGIAFFVLFLGFTPWVAAILAGIRRRLPPGQLEQLRLSLTTAGCFFVTSAWLAWVQEGAAHSGRTWTDYFVGEDLFSLRWWLETPTPGPYGGPLPLAAVVMSAALTVANVGLGRGIEGRRSTAPLRIVATLGLGCVAFPFVRLGVVWPLLACALAYLVWSRTDESARDASGDGAEAS